MSSTAVEERLDSALPTDPAHEWLRRVYDESARTYRNWDEEHISGEDYQEIARQLRAVSASFGREIDVLDLGCGTGRYFHCIESARTLVGLDISQEMLAAARNPVRADEVTARNIKLLQGDLFSAEFAPGSFDFVYCLGVFGNGCGVTRRACDQILHWLKPGGLWFFDATDTSYLPSTFRVRKNLVAQVYGLLPSGAKAAWVRRKGWPPFFCTSFGTVRKALVNAGFAVEWITSRRSQLPGGVGYKVEALCRKLTS